MMLAMPIRHPLTGSLLVAEGLALNRTLISRLRELEVHSVWIRYPDTEMIERYISPTILEEQGRLVHEVADLFDGRRHDAHTPLDYSRFRATLRELIESLVIEPMAATYISELGGRANNDLRHTSEVCFLSLLMGLKLEGYLVEQRKRLKPSHARNVVSLGLGAMVHDIGMLRIDPAVRELHRIVNDANDPRWQMHVEMGYREVVGSVEPSAAGIVLNHHQHFDGSGFPRKTSEDGESRGQSGHSIHVFARIVCVADHFDRLRHPPGGPIYSRVRVLRAMLQSPLRRRFDPVILRTLPMVVPPYQPGSMVTLSTGDRGVVTAWDPLEPCRPTVRILADRADSQTEPWVDAGDTVDLREERSIIVVEHEGCNVAKDNFDLDPATARRPLNSAPTA
jgi:HD-GYP domain-containing protein (c-di-GMP phosphodiesterase class II)